MFVFPNGAFDARTGGQADLQAISQEGQRKKLVVVRHGAYLHTVQFVYPLVLDAAPPTKILDAHKRLLANPLGGNTILWMTAEAMMGHKHGRARAYFMMGDGGVGKSIVLEMIKRLFGKGMTSSPSQHMHEDIQELHHIGNARALLVDETEVTAKRGWDDVFTPLFKRLTGGGSINIRTHHGLTYEKKLQCTWISLLNKPRSGMPDNVPPDIARRARIVPVDGSAIEKTNKTFGDIIRDTIDDDEGNDALHGAGPGGCCAGC